MNLRQFLAISFQLSAFSLLTACASLTPGQEAALRAAAKVALSVGLGELTDRVKEVRPYKDKLNTLFETTFSKATPPESLGAQLKAGVAKVVPAELQAVVLAQLKESLSESKTTASAAGGRDFNRRVAAGL